MKKKIRILLVDDEEQFVTNLARILEVRGFDVTGVYSGYDAVDTVKYGGGFDVVVLDVKMPGMDGLATLGEIKKWAPDTEVIMLTGHATLPSGSEAIRKGAYDYLMKPCDVEDLMEKIKEAHEAENIRRHPVLWPRKMVRDIPLHPPVGLGPDESVVRALEVMGGESCDRAIDEIYILNPDDRLQGLVCRRNLLNEAQKVRDDLSITWSDLLENPEWLPKKSLREIMKTDPITTQSNAYLTDAANQMFINNVRSLPVVRAGKVVGVIKMLDIFHYLDEEIG